MEQEDEIIKGLLSTLKEYNPNAYQLMETLNSAMTPIALILLFFLFFLEFHESHRQLELEQGRMNGDLLLHIAWKYFIAFALVVLSGKIIDGLIEVNQIISSVVQSVLPKGKSSPEALEKISGDLTVYQKSSATSMYTLALFFSWFSSMTAKLLVLFRFFQLYLFKGIASLLVFTYMSEQWRGVALRYFQRMIAIVIQGMLLLVVLKLFPLLFQNGWMTLSTEGSWENNLGNAFLSMVKSGFFIATLFLSQRIAKLWMG